MKPSPALLLTHRLANAWNDASSDAAQRILLVEPDELRAADLIDRLEPLGVESLRARNERDAWDRWCSEGASCGLLLVALGASPAGPGDGPTLNAAAVVRRIRGSSSAGMRVPIIALAAVGGDAVLDLRCRLAGFDECIAFDSDAETLQDLLLRWRPRARVASGRASTTARAAA